MRRWPKGCRDWPTPHAENWAKLRRLEKALWRVADWPAVGAATKELEKRGVVLDHRTPEVVHLSSDTHSLVDPAPVASTGCWTVSPFPQG